MIRDWILGVRWNVSHAEGVICILQCHESLLQQKSNKDGDQCDESGVL